MNPSTHSLKSTQLKSTQLKSTQLKSTQPGQQTRVGPGKISATSLNDTQVGQIQVLGPVTIHVPGQSPEQLTGTSRALLSLLVAAGPGGLVAEDLASAFWEANRPERWERTLEMSLRRLAKKLPARCSIVQDLTGLIALQPRDCWVDAWALAGVYQTRPPLPRRHPQLSIEDLERAHAASRLLVLGAQPASRNVALERLQQGQRAMTTRSVVADDRYGVDHVAFAVAFPTLRDKILDIDGRTPRARGTRIWRLFTDSLNRAAATGPYRVIIHDAHRLDSSSLIATAMMLEYLPKGRDQIIVVGDETCDVPEWQELLAAVPDWPVEVLRT